MPDKEIFGLASSVLAVVSNGAYFVSVVRKKTRPHVFSWVIWGLMTAITFFAQTSADAGPGAWPIAANSFCCFSVAALAVTRGRHDIRRSDIIAFACALTALPLWYITHEALTAVIVAIAVEIFGYYPTFRKSYIRPREEMAFSYATDTVRAALSIPAIASYSLTTLLYPVYAIIINGLLVAMLLWRRRSVFT